MGHNFDVYVGKRWRRKPKEHEERNEAERRGFDALGWKLWGRRSGEGIGSVRFGFWWERMESKASLVINMGDLLFMFFEPKSFFGDNHGRSTFYVL